MSMTQDVSSVNRAKCWFCGNKEPSSGQHLVVPMFRRNPAYESGTMWEDKHIHVPRCSSCVIKHKIARYAPVAFGICVGIVGAAATGTFGAIMGFIIGIVAGSMYKRYAIDNLESRLIDFDLIKSSREGWIKHLPGDVGYFNYGEKVIPSDPNRKPKSNKEDWKMML